METLKEKNRKPEYDFRPTGYPDLDAINGLIKLADRYMKESNIEKCKELQNTVKKALDERYNAVMGITNPKFSRNEKTNIDPD